MSEKLYAYGRVSTREQSLDRQEAAFLAAGVPPENCFVDKQSGKDFDRPAYRRMLKALRQGDTLYINIKTPHLIQTQTKVQTSEMLATRAFSVFCCPTATLSCRKDSMSIGG